MQSSIINVSEILNNAKKLSSAGFSVEYSFDNEKAALYFDELVENSLSPTPIFSGILILEKNGEDFIIVDGLQRLITLSLLLCALCENYKGTSKVNEEARLKILNRFLITSNEEGKESKLQIKGAEFDIYLKILLLIYLQHLVLLCPCLLS